MAAASRENLAAASAQDARKFARSRVPIAARLADGTGDFIGDCTIRDLSRVGAQIALPEAGVIPEDLYLVDLSNLVAHRARVAWWRPHAAGLAFQETYPLDENLPSQLGFLRQLLIEAKLKEVEALTASGHALADAVQKAGLTSEMYVRWSSEQARDDELTQRLWQLETENALLRKMMSESGGGRPRVKARSRS